VSVGTVRPGEVQLPGEPVSDWKLSRFAEDVYRSLGATTHPDPGNGFALAALVEALCWLPSLIDDAAVPEPGTGETPWAAVVDPWRCPWWALRWCGGLYGLRLEPDPGPFVPPAEAVEQAWRRAIHDRLSWRRGHPDTIVAAARRHMVPGGQVQMRERYDPSLGAGIDAPYTLQVRVRRSHVLPGISDSTVIQAVRAAIPIGLIAFVVISDDATYDDRRDAHDDFDALRDAYIDYDDLRDAD
jgi:hypothetical protein